MVHFKRRWRLGNRKMYEDNVRVNCTLMHTITISESSAGRYTSQSWPAEWNRSKRGGMAQRKERWMTCVSHLCSRNNVLWGSLTKKSYWFLKNFSSEYSWEILFQLLAWNVTGRWQGPVHLQAPVDNIFTKAFKVMGHSKITFTRFWPFFD